MNDQRKEEAIALINAELEYHRNEYRKAGIDMDPLADVIVRAEEDHVVFIYDGAGNDYFSHNSELTMPRDRLFTALDEAGFDIEDRNNWSSAVREA